MGKNEGKASEEEEISDTARQGYLECQGKNSGDRESLTVDINREGFLLIMDLLSLLLWIEFF